MKNLPRLVFSLLGFFSGLAPLSAQVTSITNGNFSSWSSGLPDGWSASGSSPATTWSVARTSQLDSSGAALVTGNGSLDTSSYGILTQSFTALPVESGFRVSFNFVVNKTPGLTGFSQPFIVNLYRAGSSSTPWLKFNFNTSSPAYGPYSIELKGATNQTVFSGGFLAGVAYHLSLTYDGAQYSIAYNKLSEPTNVTILRGLSTFYSTPATGGLNKLALAAYNAGFVVDDVRITSLPVVNGGFETWTSSILPANWSTSGSGGTYSIASTTGLGGSSTAARAIGNNAVDSTSYALLSHTLATPLDVAPGFQLSFNFTAHATPGLASFTQPLIVNLVRAGSPSTPWLRFNFFSYTPAAGPFTIELKKVGASSQIFPAGFEAGVPYHVTLTYNGSSYEITYHKLSTPGTLVTASGLATFYSTATGNLSKIEFAGYNAGFTLDDVRVTPARATAVTIESASLLDSPFQGFGAEWDPYQDTRNPLTTADFNLVKSRIEWMKLPLTRMMMLARWAQPSAGTYDFNSAGMQALYKNLDVCQQLGIDVALTEWGYNDTWMFTPGITGIDDPAYAEIIGTYLDHLVNVKGYTCIKHFIFVNEASWIQQTNKAGWKTGLANIAAQLSTRGLDSQIRLSATDGSIHNLASLDTMSWLTDVFPVSSTLGTYELHSYVTLDDMRKGDLHQIFANAWDQVRVADSDTTKPLLITEAGYWVNNTNPALATGGSNNPLNLDWRYGLYMAEYAHQVVEAGTSGVIAWMLDDNSHYGFNWGLWTDVHGGMALKPWAYPWSLFTRMFPKGSTFRQTTSTNPQVLAIAAQHPGTPAKWTVCVINKSNQPARTTLTVPGTGTLAASHYLYSQFSSPKDGAGMPIPTGALTITYGSPTEVYCPPESVLFIVPTSLVPTPTP